MIKVSRKRLLRPDEPDNILSLGSTSDYDDKNFDDLPTISITPPRPWSPTYFR
jgi:hypothetical protein